MSVQERSESRELTTDEINDVSGGWLAAGIALGVLCVSLGLTLGDCVAGQLTGTLNEGLHR